MAFSSIKLKNWFKFFYFVIICAIPTLTIIGTLRSPSTSEQMHKMRDSINHNDSNVLMQIDDTYEALFAGNYQQILNDSCRYASADECANFEKVLPQIVNYLIDVKQLKYITTKLNYSYNPVSGFIYEIKTQREYEVENTSDEKEYLLFDLYFTKLSQDIWIINGLNIKSNNDSLANTSQISLANTTLNEFAILAALIIIPILIIFAEYICLFKTNYKLKWLWSIFILQGFCCFEYNFALKQGTSTMLSMLLYSASFWRESLYGDLKVTIAIPIVALVFLTKYFFDYRYKRKVVSVGVVS